MEYFCPGSSHLRTTLWPVKEGDYDGRLLLVSKDGVTHDLIGGWFFLTEDRRFLVTEYFSDLYEVVVSISKRIRKYWRHRIFRRSEVGIKTIPDISLWSTARPDHAERLDLERGQLVKITVSPAERSTARKVMYDFDARKMRDCTSDVQ